VFSLVLMGTMADTASVASVSQNIFLLRPKLSGLLLRRLQSLLVRKFVGQNADYLEIMGENVYVKV
jgi:hypothetical protein